MTTGVLFIHGFTGGTYEVQPLVTYVKSRTDWLTEVPTLPGHGVTLDLRDMSAESWMMEAEQAMQRLQQKVDRIIVVGFSMGGLIAMYLTLRYPVEKLILLSAAAKYISPRVLLKDLQTVLAESVLRRYKPTMFSHLFQYKLTNTPIRATFEFLRIVKMVEPYYANIKAPVCIVQGEKDPIVPFSAAAHLYEKLGSSTKRLITSPFAKHHICYSDDCDDWFEEVLRFMKAEEAAVVR